MSTNTLGGMTLSSGPESDIPESLSIIREGYDYVFVPKFGPGYECPICLSVLREPRQTKCGHRFCRDCISHWMSESSNRCPVDNEPLSEAELFPDNCIKREILSCPVKCPNHVEGCTELTTILQMQKHLDQCLLSLVPCPFNCFSVIPRRDLEDHQSNQCEFRIISCQSCHKDMPACRKEEHKSKCPKEVIKCSHCSIEILREELNHHVECECKNVVVPCPFHALGCKETVLREIEGIHLSAEIPSHLKMLATSLNTVLQGFSSLATGLRHIDKNLGTTRNDTECQNSIVESGIHSGDRSGSSFNESFQRQRCQNHRHSGSSCIESENSSTMHGNMGQRSSSNSGISVYANESSNNNNNNDNNISVESHHHSFSSMPQSSRVLEDKEISENANNHNAPASKLPLTGSQSVPILYQRSVPASETPSADPAFGADILQPNIAEFANSLRDLCVHQQQIIGKQQVIVTNLCAKLASAESRLKQLEGDGAVGSAQSTCGDFFWSINDFSVHREKALHEETSILHSPAFYSSPWGYKLCLRVNVNGSFNAQGERFVSLFIHFMQGNNDHLLNWPFVGQIMLSIIDQNPACKERRHATETLKARPDIAAFQKPTSARNHKGFGYTDFISLNVLDNGNFVRDDTLIIRAQVFPSPL